MKLLQIFSFASARNALLDSGQIGLDLAPGGEGPVVRLVLDAHTVLDELAALPHALVVGALPLGETPLLADVDLLSARELELGPTEGLDNVIL